jgi:hypothetical protein
MILSRSIAALAYAGAAFLLGLGLGERGELGVVQHVFSVVIPVATVILAVSAKSGRAETLLTGIAMFTALYLGQQSFNRAFEQCPAYAPFVRDAIVRHQRETGDYPARLDDLAIKLPCECLLRDTILHYNSSERGFGLWITNDRRTFQFGRRRVTAI